MSVPFRERNPVIIGAISLAVIAAADPRRLQRRGPAADRRRRHLLRRVHRGRRAQGQRRGPHRRRPRRQGRDGRARRRPRARSPSGSTDGVDFGTETARRDQGQDAARRDVPRARARPAPASSTEGAEIPVDAHQLAVRRGGGVLGPRRDRPSRSTPTSWPSRSTTLADLTRNTPEEFRGALDGVSRLSANVAARDEQINTLLSNLEQRLRRSSTTATRTSSR